MSAPDLNEAERRRRGESSGGRQEGRSSGWGHRLDARLAGLIPFAITLVVLIYLVERFYPEPTRLPKSLIFNPPFPFSSLHTLFVAFSALTVAYFFARSFLSSGSLNMITLGTGSVILALGITTSSILGNPPFGSAVQLTGISVVTFLAAGIMFGIFATLSILNRAPNVGKRAPVVAASYLGAVAVVALVALVIETKVTPPFYVIGSGPTFLRREVLGAAALLFTYSSMILMKDYFGTRAPVLYWFALGMASIAFGFTINLIGTYPGSPLSWLGRSSVAVGGAYFLAAVLTTYRKTRAEKKDDVRLGESYPVPERSPAPLVSANPCTETGLTPRPSRGRTPTSVASNSAHGHRTSRSISSARPYIGPSSSWGSPN